MHIAHILGKNLPPVKVSKQGSVTSPKKDILVHIVGTAWRAWRDKQIDEDEAPKNKAKMKPENKTNN